MTAFDLPASVADIFDAAEASLAACGTDDLDVALSRIGGDGLLGVLAPEPAGLALELPAAVAVVRAAGAGCFAIPLGPVLAASDILAREAGLAEKAFAGEVLVTAAPVADLAPSGGRVAGRALLVPLADRAGLLVAPVGGAVAIVDLAAGGVAMHLSSPLDEARPAYTLDIDAAPALLVDDPALVAEWHARDLLFRAAEGAAAAGAALTMAIAHLTDRQQFGRTLISFQSLRHDLARARMDLHSLDRLILQSADAAPGESRLAAAEMAYARAASVVPPAIEMALHMHGGMGFTREVRVHEFLRRARGLFAGRDGAWADALIATRILADDTVG
ncbi:acyl-CoA dehydrogenase family protein [Acuticoccus mangrovi]|uniref:Acyl-CoA dehydrogenase/oxidase C-terminal domain-containing protein n=1 Tax=Acuticoccus mangrovi TaxID=2796142 RepID=A0A934IL94_9HYPH|nr:acyl-CoA dehydrogenase family protein [Acuticoccus mangrovi]MBJ3777046.1 hypothetical protein [Acuticoccus mangrovi]